MIRVGVVSYLNARPLVDDLGGDERLHLVAAPPAEVADMLASGRIDMGLVPSVALLGIPDAKWIPGLCIGADGPVESVLLYVRNDASGRPVAAHRVALDRHSRTSQVLTRILLEETDRKSVV